MVATYLRNIAQLGDTLLRDLHKPDALARGADVLAEAVHRLAGSAGMFGFERLAAAGLQFERAVQIGSADTSALADALRTAIEASLREVNSISGSQDQRVAVIVV
jgi:HPt (histidine-containing phosphotransfer) domain-containing protein